MENAGFKPGQAIDTDSAMNDMPTFAERVKNNVPEALEYLEKHPELKQKLGNTVKLLTELNGLSDEELEARSETSGKFLSTVESFNNTTRNNAERDAKIDDLETRKLDSNLDNQEKANGILETDDEAYARQKQEIQNQYGDANAENYLVAGEIDQQREAIQLEISNIETELKNLEMAKDYGQIALDRWSNPDENYEDKKNMLDQKLADAHARLNAIGGDAESEKATNDELQKAYEDAVRYIEANKADDYYDTEEDYQKALDGAKQALAEGRLDALLNRAGTIEQNQALLDKIIADGKEELAQADANWADDAVYNTEAEYGAARKAAQDKINNPSKYLAEYKLKQETNKKQQDQATDTTKTEATPADTEKKPKKIEIHEVGGKTFYDDIDNVSDEDKKSAYAEIDSETGDFRLASEDGEGLYTGGRYTNEKGEYSYEQGAPVIINESGIESWYEKQDSLEEQMARDVKKGDPVALEWLEHHPMFKDDIDAIINKMDRKEEAEKEEFNAFLEDHKDDRGMFTTEEEFIDAMRALYEREKNPKEDEKALEEERAKAVGEMMDEGEEEVEPEKRGILSKIKGFFGRFKRTKDGKERAAKKGGLKGWRKALYGILLGLTLFTRLSGSINVGGDPMPNADPNVVYAAGTSSDDAEAQRQEQLLQKAAARSLEADLKSETITSVMGHMYGEDVELDVEMPQYSGESSYYSDDKYAVHSFGASVYDRETMSSKTPVERTKETYEGSVDRLVDPVAQPMLLAGFAGGDFVVGNESIKSMGDMNHVFDIAQTDDEARQKFADYLQGQFAEYADKYETRTDIMTKGSVYLSPYVLDKADPGEQPRMQFYLDDEVTAREDIAMLNWYDENGDSVLDSNEPGGFKENLLRGLGIITDNMSDEEVKDILNKYHVRGIGGVCGLQPYLQQDQPDSGDESAGNESVGNESAGNESVGNESAGDESAGDESAGDESVGDESVGNESVGDESAGNESIGDESAGDESAGNESVGSEGDESVGSESVGNESVGDESAGAEGSAGNESIGDESAGIESIGDESAGDESSVGNESAGDESAGNESAGDESAGDESAGDESAGDESAGDESAGDEGSAGNESAGDEGSAGNESVGDESAGAESVGDESAGNESAGDESAGDESVGDESAGAEDAYDGKTETLPDNDGDGWTSQDETPEDNETQRSEAGEDGNGYTNDNTSGSSSDKITIPVDDKNEGATESTDDHYSEDNSTWRDEQSDEPGTQTIDDEPSSQEEVNQINDSEANQDSAGSDDTTGADKEEAMNRFDQANQETQESQDTQETQEDQ